jgi:AcrR family transcriptional regulator
VHSEDKILDGARAIVLDEGAPAATIKAIARASDAPSGSIYHRFGSRDVVLVELWIRAVHRSQARFLEALGSRPDPIEAIVAAGLTILDFATDERDDARLLASLRYEDLVRSELPAPTKERLRDLNGDLRRAIGRVAADLYGDDSAAARELVTLAAFDIPYGAIRRHLLAGSAPPGGLRPHLERAMRAVLGGEPDHRPRSTR